MNRRHLKQDIVEDSQSDQVKIAPPRKRKKFNRNKANWPAFLGNISPGNFIPHIPYAYPYKCGFAIPLIPFPIGMASSNPFIFPKEDEFLCGNLQRMDKNMGVLKASSYSGSAPILKDGSLQNLDLNQKVNRPNLSRTDSSVSTCSKKKISSALKQNVINVLEDYEHTEVSAEELALAFKKLEENVNTFKKFISQNLSEDNSHNNELMRTNNEAGEANAELSNTKSNQCSPTSSCEQFAGHNQREKFTFSQRIEEISNQGKPTSFDVFNQLATETDELMWILKPQADMTENLSGTETEFSKRRNIVVRTLCFGQGFDQSDWILFQQLVSHSLCIKEKMKFLNAEVICTENSNAGVASLRNSLLSISKYGESLLNFTSNDYPNFSCISYDESQHWTKIKGCLEILQLFGYNRQGPYQLCYNRSSIMADKVFVAELTLDILILAEEFRLYLDGLHAYPIFITQLFSRGAKSHGPFISSYHPHSKISANRKDIMNPLSLRESPKEDKLTLELHNEILGLHNGFAADLCNTSTTIENKDQNGFNEKKSEYDDNASLSPKLPPKTKQNISTSSFNSTKKVTSHKKYISDITGVRPPAEDHIYEEISEVKLELKKFNQSQPPPLPKKKTLLNIRNNINKSTISSKKFPKKRSAPMPPLFNCNSNLDSGKSSKPPHKYNSAVVNSRFCRHCGKLSVKQAEKCSSKSVNTNKIISPSVVSAEKHVRHFIVRDCIVNYKNHAHINTDDLLYPFDKVSSRSIDNLTDFKKKQNINDIFIRSTSLPLMFLNKKCESINFHIPINQKENSIEKFENSKNLILSKKCDRLILHNDKPLLNSDHTDKAQELEIQLIKNELDQNSSNINENKSSINCDIIPFIDSAEDTSSCSSDSDQDCKPNKFLKNNSCAVPETSLSFGDSLNCHKISAESLEVKEILFRKCTSDSALTNDIFRLNALTTSYREPVIFNAQNYDSKKPCEEDRYEIPEIPMQERNVKDPILPLESEQTQVSSVKGGELPERPIRKRKNPPLPPKPTVKPPPKLPPKGLLSLATTNVFSKNSPIHKKKPLSSPYTANAGGSLPVLPTKYSSTGLVFVGNKGNPEAFTDVKPRKYWPNLFCSCLPKTGQNG